jgi:hypothetical protein
MNFLIRPFTFLLSVAARRVEVDRAKGRGTLTRSVNLAQRVPSTAKVDQIFGSDFDHLPL